MASQDFTLRKENKLKEGGFGRISALMVCSGRSDAVLVIIMALSFILFSIRVQSSCSRPWFVADLGGKQVSAQRGKLHACTSLSWRWHCYVNGLDGRRNSAISGKLSTVLEFRIGCNLFALQSLFLVVQCLPLRTSIWFVRVGGIIQGGDVVAEDVRR